MSKTASNQLVQMPSQNVALEAQNFLDGKVSPNIPNNSAPYGYRIMHMYAHALIMNAFDELTDYEKKYVSNMRHYRVTSENQRNLMAKLVRGYLFREVTVDAPDMEYPHLIVPASNVHPLPKAKRGSKQARLAKVA